MYILCASNLHLHNVHLSSQKNAMHPCLQIHQSSFKYNCTKCFPFSFWYTYVLISSDCHEQNPFNMRSDSSSGKQELLDSKDDYVEGIIFITEHCFAMSIFEGRMDQELL